MKDWKPSKKMSVALLVIFIEVLRGYGVQLPVESYLAIEAITIAYLSGQSIVDVALAIKGVKKS